MKERIYSILLTDALNANCDCPLCAVEKKLESDALDYFLGASMMEPDERTFTNAKGFCRRHLHSLYDRGNRLSFALILDTHINEARGKLARKSRPPKSGVFSRGAAKKSVEKMCGAIDEIVNSCALCEKLDGQMRNCARNFVCLWNEEPEFREKFEAAKGLCLPHMRLILHSASDEIGGKKLDEFLKIMYDTQNKTLQKLNEDMNWFTQKYDYRNQDAPWGDSKHVLPRAVSRLGKY